VGFVAQAEAVTVPAATADYRFQGSLGSRGAAVPDLVEIGEGTSAFTDEGMIGRAVLSFAQGSGLSLSPTTGVIEGTEYTIELLFRFDRLDGYRKIIDFKEGTDDDGLYVLDGCLNFYPRHPRAAIPIEADSYVQVVLTRDPSSFVVGYVDGIRQFAFRDAAALAEIASETLRFFVDDSITGGDEYSSGAVSQIRLYDRPLTANEVAALACAEIRIPLATHPCPDPR
jgi:Concanavalin A-like lectin/glucanases superfamily